MTTHGFNVPVSSILHGSSFHSLYVSVNSCISTRHKHTDVTCSVSNSSHTRRSNLSSFDRRFPRHACPQHFDHRMHRDSQRPHASTPRKLMHVGRGALRLAACGSTRLRTPPTVLQCAHSPPRLALWRACSTRADVSAAADAIVALSSDRQRVAQWLQEYFDWRLLTPKVAEAMPQEAVDKFDEL